MELRCPACDYDLTGRVSEICPECGGVSTDEELFAHGRSGGRPHPRADIASHGCALGFCVFVSSICGMVATAYGAPAMLIGSLLFAAFAVGLTVSLGRVVRGWRSGR